MRPLSRFAPARLARFAGVGLVATATDFTIFNLALTGADDPAHLRILLANTAAFAVATLVGYVLNARFTFRVARDRASLLRYATVALGGAAVYDLSLLAILQGVDAGDPLELNLGKLGAVALSATWNFSGFALFAFAGARLADREGVRA